MAHVVNYIYIVSEAVCSLAEVDELARHGAARGIRGRNRNGVRSPKGGSFCRGRKPPEPGQSLPRARRAKEELPGVLLFRLSGSPFNLSRPAAYAAG